MMIPAGHYSVKAAVEALKQPGELLKDPLPVEARPSLPPAGDKEAFLDKIDSLRAQPPVDAQTAVQAVAQPVAQPVTPGDHILNNFFGHKGEVNMAEPRIHQQFETAFPLPVDQTALLHDQMVLMTTKTTQATGMAASSSTKNNIEAMVRQQ